MKNKAGFTLMELIVAIAIIAVLAGVAVPAVNSLRARHGFSAALQDVLLTLRQARLVAIEENETVMVSVDKDTGTYKAFVNDGAGSVDGNNNGILDGAEDYDCLDEERVIMNGTVPKGVSITGADFSGAVNFCYDNRGFPVEAKVGGLLTGGTITLENREGGSKQISLLRSGHSVIQ